MNTSPAAGWSVSQWFNSDGLTLASLRTRRVLLHDFQMLYPAACSTRCHRASKSRWHSPKPTWRSSASACELPRAPN